MKDEPTPEMMAKRLSEAQKRAASAAHAQGMIEAARICGSLAETTYDDAEGFVAATGCEAAIMKAASALSAPQGEVERGTLPRLDEGLIIAAMRGHYGSKADSIDGLDLTVDDVNWTFRDGFTRMWAGVRKELKRRAALAQPKGGDHR